MIEESSSVSVFTFCGAGIWCSSVGNPQKTQYRSLVLYVYINLVNYRSNQSIFNCFSYCNPVNIVVLLKILSTFLFAMSFTNLIRFEDSGGRLRYGDILEANLNNIIGSEVQVLEGDPYSDCMRPTNETAVVCKV